MKSLLAAIVAALAFAAPSPASAEQTESGQVDRWKLSLQSARWTGPMLASTPETLPRGHFYTEPYLFDVISAGNHSSGVSGYYQYGLFDSFTVGVQPSFGYGTQRGNHRVAIGDFKLLSQVRLTHFTPEHRVPSVSIVLQEVIPTGEFDRLRPSKQGSGSGSFATEIGVNAQYYFLLKNDRLLRARINVVERFSHGTGVVGRSVYGTVADFRGHALPGRRTTLISAVEYSVTREWVLALDVMSEFNTKTTVTGRNGPAAPLVRQTIPASSYFGIAPAVEYNWSDRSGVLLGLWVIPKGHNTPSSVTPALAFSRFW